MSTKAEDLIYKLIEEAEQSMIKSDEFDPAIANYINKLVEQLISLKGIEVMKDRPYIPEVIKDLGQLAHKEKEEKGELVERVKAYREQLIQRNSHSVRLEELEPQTYSKSVQPTRDNTGSVLPASPSTTPIHAQQTFEPQALDWGKGGNPDSRMVDDW